MLIARYGNKQLADKALHSVKSVTNRWDEKNPAGTGERVSDKGVTGRSR
jgi:hypothetical protein